MNADTIRMVGTYAIAMIVLAGCFVLLIFPSQVQGRQPAAVHDGHHRHGPRLGLQRPAASAAPNGQ